MARHAPNVTIAGVAGREWSLREGRQATLALLKLDEPPTALVASSVELALGGMLACRELGVRIPDDLALAAFDDAYFAELLDPPLTAVAYQPREVGEAAASLLVEAMGEDEPGARDLRFAVRLIVRGSCGCTG
jgi:LacI family transcriptional regulator